MKTAIQNQQLIDLQTLTEKDLTELKAQQNYTCTYCHQPMRLKSGPKRKAHFAHITACDHPNSQAESENHYQAKKLLANWLENQGIKTQIEYGFSEIKRIADLFLDTLTNPTVIEIQNSPITVQIFQLRNKDYRKLELSVFWISLGKLEKRNTTFILNKVMMINKNLPLIHLNLETQTLTKFDQVTWVSSKEIYARSQSYFLGNMSFSQLLTPIASPLSSSNWLIVKTEFRKHKWQPYMKYERALCQLCAKYRINLALLPAEVGWPIVGSGFGKHLFIWQAYILMSIVSFYEVGDCFTLQDLIKKLKIYYQLNVDQANLLQLKNYLDHLVYFDIISCKFAYYEYEKAPIFYERIEPLLEADRQLCLTLNFGKEQ